jgi:head-tail adaptor
MTAIRPSRRLTLEAPQPAADGAGGFTTLWTPLGTLWGEIAHAAPRETALPAGSGTVLPVRVTLRAAPPGAPSRPRPGQRLREGTRAYVIDAVAPATPDGRWLTCHAHEEAAP